MIWMLLALVAGYVAGVLVGVWRTRERYAPMCADAYNRGRDDAISFLVV